MKSLHNKKTNPLIFIVLSLVLNQQAFGNINKDIFKVDHRTQLKGALLATVDKDNNDLGNLNLTTGSVDKTNNNATGTKLNTTKVQYVNSTGYTKTKTLATLGKGTIQITNSDDETLTRLNRDTTKTNKDIYKTKRQQGNIDLTIDTRLFSKDGRNAIKEDVLRTGMIANTLGLIATTEKVGITDFFRELGKANTTYDAIKTKIAQSPALAAALQNPDLTKKQRDAMLDEVTGAVMVQLGYKTYNNVTIATTAPGRDGQQVKGYYSTDTKKAYINALYNDSNRDLITTAGVESTRAMDQQDGVDFNQNREDRSIYARNYGSNLANYTDMALILSGNEGLANSNNSRSNRSDYVLANNTEFIGLDKTQGDNIPFLLAVPVALELIDKGLTVYDAYQLKKAISEGRTEDAKNITTELGMGLITEVIPGNKILLKVRKVVGGSGKAAEKAAKAGKTTADNKYFTSKTQYKAPDKGTGKTYTVYQQKIDPDVRIKFTDQITGKSTELTNRELMQKGRTPYVMKDGKLEQVQLHHSRQNANGSLFEVSTKTHQTKTGRGAEALHPYKTKLGRKNNGDGVGDNKSLNPGSPVTKKIRNKFDRQDKPIYWKERIKQIDNRGAH